MLIKWMIGNTSIIIDTSYIDNRTPEQAKIDDERVADAAWAIVEELIAHGEEV